jgi:exopolyphosphatase / guanosine-5'-triphosphate,3'-diphosphate pyrophosphatase
MEEVPREAAKAADGFSSEAVHDLRVALRRCRSIADGFRALDPHKDWKRMRRQAKVLFDNLGALRDCHVMMEWVERLGPESDPIAHRLLGHLRQQEPGLKRQAESAIKDFDPKQWQSWTRALPRRADRLPIGSEVFQALALEKLTAARRLQAPALKTQAETAFHRLRIGLKKFRYVVENFLPQHHQEWKDGLKQAQEILGEIHDLDVLHGVVLQLCAAAPVDNRHQWEQILGHERQVRIERFGQMMSGENSLWQVWRVSLPRGQAARQASLKKLEAWSAFLDSDLPHSHRVARFAIQIHDGLASLGLLNGGYKNSRELLSAAAIVHEVGRIDGDKNHHKTTERMVSQLDHLVGWTQKEIGTMARVARYHRGALPQTGRLRDLPLTQRHAIKLLAGILRLANALDAGHDGCIRRIAIGKSEGFVVIHAQGLVADSALAERIAGARHLLEITCKTPVVVQPFLKHRIRRRTLTSS